MTKEGSNTKDDANTTGARAVALRPGNQTAFAAPLFEPFEFAVANKFAAFEFFPDRGPSGNGGWDERELDSQTRRYIRDTAQRHGIRLTVHASLEFNPLHDPESDRLYSSVEFASDIGATLLNIHLDASQGVERFAGAIGPTLLATAETGLQLALENTVHSRPEDFNSLFGLLASDQGHPVSHAGMCFDLGHANACAATQNDYWKFLDQLSAGVPIIHLHLHENFGDRDSHLTLFTGPSASDDAGLRGFLSRLRQRGFDGCGIFEQWPQPPSLLTDARDRLMKMIHA
ncbi:MAG TPA: sugar phosphate isomerase/epimerase family protein [Verrucomicrobiota bacterium]|nr:sugar phosphate isomerase/epimerase family protein [Verrucomicrobiota bacterium]